MLKMWLLGCIHTKGVYWRFDFDAIRISQIQNSLSKQSNGDAPRGVYIQPVLYIVVFHLLKTISIWVFIYKKHQRGAFDVARSDKLGNARAFIAWNEQK